MTPAAVMLCYNESSILPVTLAALKECVSEIIVVDMGSTDGTHDYLAENLRRSDKIVAYDRRSLFQFGFSHPRNYGAKFTSSSFIMAIDADELIFPDEFASAWSSVDKNANIIAVWGWNYKNPNGDILASPEGCRSYEYGVPQPCPRIYRNAPLIRYEGLIHEAIWDRDQRGYDMSPPFLDCPVHHLAEFKESRGQPQEKYDLYAYLTMKAQAYSGFRFGSWDQPAVDREIERLFARANIFAAENGLSQFGWDQVAPGRAGIIF